MSNNISKDTKILVERYLVAACNLYAIVPLSKILSIYNSQNEPISEKDFLSIIDTIDLKNTYYDIIGEDVFYDDVDKTASIDRDLIADHLLMDEDFEDYYRMKDEQFGKDYYVPDKEQFLKYEDQFYHEKTLSFISLRTFFRSQPNLTRERADEITEDIYGMGNVLDGEILKVVNFIEEMRYFEFNFDTFNEFAQLYVDMYNDTRLNFNRGFTPREMYER